MAEENQGRSPSAPRGVPGVQQPPVPPADLVAKIMAEQQTALAQQRFEAQKRAAEAAGMPIPKQEEAAPQFARATAPTVPAAPQPHQSQRQTQAAGNQFAQFSAPEIPDKPRVPWMPTYGGGLEIELTDAVIFGVPKAGISGENNSNSKVILCLFSEILALREQIAALMEGGRGGNDEEISRRVSALEGVLYEQRKGMNARARGVREQIEMFTAKGMSAEDILSALSAQADAAALAAKAGGEG